MIQAQWGDIVFGIEQDIFRNLQELSFNFRVKKKTDNTANKTIISGNELQTFTIPYPVSFVVGMDPLEEYQKLKSRLGKVAPLLLQGSLCGPDLVILKNVELTCDKLTPEGKMISANISLEFREYSSGKKQIQSSASKYISPFLRNYYQDTKTAVEDLKLKIKYNDKDITDYVSINSCIHDMYACSEADTLTIRFNDTSRLWDNWNPQKEEFIALSCVPAKTGNLYINTVKPENGLMTLRASSIPPTAKKSSEKSWEDVRILQLGKEIADRHGLGFESYGVENYLYSYVRQENEPDFVFLQRRCDLESLAFVVYDKKLIIYSEEWLEEQEALKDLSYSEDANFEYSDNELRGFGSMTIKNGDITGFYDAKNGLSRTDTRVINTYISSTDEANRFAKGILRQENKKLATGIINDSIMRDLSAGSIFNLKTNGANSWNGKVFVSHIRQDYVDSKSKIFFRKI